MAKFRIVSWAKADLMKLVSVAKLMVLELALLSTRAGARFSPDARFGLRCGEGLLHHQRSD